MKCLKCEGDGRIYVATDDEVVVCRACDGRGIDPGPQAARPIDLDAAEREISAVLWHLEAGTPQSISVDCLKLNRRLGEVFAYARSLRRQLSAIYTPDEGEVTR